MGVSEIPASLTEPQIKSLPGDPDFLKAVIADRESRLGKAREIFKAQRSELAELAEAKKFRELMDQQADRIHRLIDDGYCDDDPKTDIVLVTKIRALVEELSLVRGERAVLRSHVDQVRLIWSGGSLTGTNPADSPPWKALLETIRKEASNVQAGDVPPF